jgi:hypothetical protein
VSDEHTEQPAEQPTPEPAAEQPTEHHVKEEFRGAVAKVVGLAVEAGSMLSGYSGEMVSAEGKVAESDTEQLLDRIDGEG